MNFPLVERIRDAPDAEQQWRVLTSAVVSDPDGAAAAAFDALDSAEKDDRRIGFDLLGQLVTTEALPASAVSSAILSRLGVETAPDALAAAIIALGHAGDSNARDAVVGFAPHPSVDVRFAVAWALPSLGLDGEGVRALVSLSSDADEDVRNWATFGLGESDIRDSAVSNALLARVDDPHEETRAEAILGLARRKHERAIGLVRREVSRTGHGALIDEAAQLLGIPPE